MAGAGIVLGFLALLFAMLLDSFRVVILLFKSNRPGEVERGTLNLVIRGLGVFATFWLFIAVVTAASVLPKIRGFDHQMHAFQV